MLNVHENKNKISVEVDGDLKMTLSYDKERNTLFVNHLSNMGIIYEIEVCTAGPVVHLEDIEDNVIHFSTLAPYISIEEVSSKEEL